MIRAGWGVGEVVAVPDGHVVTGPCVLGHWYGVDLVRVLDAIVCLPEQIAKSNCSFTFMSAGRTHHDQQAIHGSTVRCV